MVKKSTVLEQWQTDDAARLKALFEGREPKISQMKFGEDFDIGSQGMVWQYLTGMRPLNIDAAMKFARGLNVPIDRFSERLADQIDMAYSLTERAKTRPAGLGNVVRVSAETVDEMRLLTMYRLGDDRLRTAINHLIDSVVHGVPTQTNAHQG